MALSAMASLTTSLSAAIVELEFVLTTVHVHGSGSPSAV